MDDPLNQSLAGGLLGPGAGAYVEQGARELARRGAAVRLLLSQRRLPPTPWDEPTIEWFLAQLSVMDSNNFTGSVGVGEREGRIGCGLVRRRNYGFGHGVGRSGDIEATQPKAGGSSLLYKLANRLALHAVQSCGITRAASALVLPLATGMSLSLVLSTLKAGRPGAAAHARFVVWPRIDQKACFKAMLTAGCVPVVVENLRGRRGDNSGSGDSHSHGAGVDSGDDELTTDLAGIEAAIHACGGPSFIVAVMTTSSCFAPRGCDDLAGVAALCARLDVPHLINNAYGLQSSKLCHEVCV